MTILYRGMHTDWILQKTTINEYRIDLRKIHLQTAPIIFRHKYNHHVPYNIIESCMTIIILTVITTDLLEKAPLRR